MIRRTRSSKIASALKWGWNKLKFPTDEFYIMDPVATPVTSSKYFLVRVLPDLRNEEKAILSSLGAPSSRRHPFFNFPSKAASYSGVKSFERSIFFVSSQFSV